VQKDGEFSEIECRYMTVHGTYRHYETSANRVNIGGGDFFFVVARDVTERRRAEDRLELVRRVLSILNEPRDRREMIRRVLSLLRDSFGFDGVALRLGRDTDFPYFETIGFPGRFVEKERYLCERDKRGELVLGADGDPSLACMCGIVLRGRTDPTAPCFTKAGSFWTSAGAEFLAVLPEDLRKASFRKTCFTEGYRSVALIPVRSEGQTVGLLQLNDKRVGVLTLDAVRFFENVAGNLGVALARWTVQEELEARERQQAAVAELGHHALAGQALSAFLDDAVAAVHRALDVEFSKVLELLPDDDKLLLRAGVGWAAGLVGKALVRAGDDSQAGFTLQSKAPVVVSDLRTERRFSGPPLLRDHNVVSGMSVLVGTADRPWGVLGAHSTRQRVFSQDDIHFLQSVANLLSDAIERNRAHEMLLESEQRFEMLFERAPLGYQSLDEDGRFIAVNQAWLDTLGYSRDEVLGRWFGEFLAPECVTRFQHNFPRFISGGGVRGVEFEMVTRDGSRLVASFDGRIGRDARGQFKQTHCILTDITERKKTEAALRRRDSILSAVATATARLTGEFTPEGEDHKSLELLGKAAGVSRAYVFENHRDADGRLLGSQRCEWVADGIEAQTDNPDVSDFPWIEGGLARWVKTLEKGDMLYGLVRDFPEAERELLEPQDILSIAAVPIFVADEWWGFIGFDECSRERIWSLAEIDALRAAATAFGSAIERGRAQAELAQSKRFLDSVINAIADPIFVKDQEHHWIALNDALCELVGRRRDEMLGKSDYDLFPKEQADVFWSHDDIVLSSDAADINEEDITAGDQTRRISTIKSAFTNPITGERNLVGTIRDITDRVRAERDKEQALKEITRLKEELENERDYLREEVNVALDFGEIVGGDSPALRKLLAQVEAVSQTGANVLILGESGVGKELVARAIHDRSERRGKALVRVNCAAIPRELFESEFFGHVKGAFTGAIRDRIGRFQLANCGTLFLDEISEIPLELQAKLLRVLQDGEFERVGEDVTRRVDVRAIAATNKNLKVAAEDGQFREDLYYRLSVFPIEVAPLRKRRADIIPLATHFLKRACEEFDRDELAFTRAQGDMLLAYDWPGNIRELRNVIERSVILSNGGRLHLDLTSPTRHDDERPDEIDASLESAEVGFVSDAEFKRRDRRNIIAALEHAGWRVSGPGGAAELLGVNSSTLSYRLRALGIRRPARQ